MASVHIFVFLSLLVNVCWSHPQYQTSGGQVEETGNLEIGFCSSASYDCVPYFQCIDGVINTDGTGLIDVRIRPTAQCTNPDYPDVPAVCCLIPGKTATPAPLETCHIDFECVGNKQCNAQGFIITDGSGIFDVRVGHTTCWQEHGLGVGVCCKPPKIILDYCPSNSICLDHGACSGQALNAADNFVDYISTGSWQECSIAYENTGICCIEPVILDYCPTGSVCTAHGQCYGQALNPSDIFVDYIQTGSWQECAGGTYNGVCCKRPILDYCPSDSVCVEHGTCLGQALNPANAFVDYVQTGSWQECAGGAYNGICCKQPVKQYKCPHNAVCRKYGECLGTALDLNGQFVDYNPIGLWEKCQTIDYTSGVCCQDPKEPLYPPANKCGVRNYHINERITSPNSNEAAFGEFPWQGIIFFSNYTFKCGASLISDRHVLTGAHCVYGLQPHDIKLRFGEWQVNTFDEPIKYEDADVAVIHGHPDFNPRNLHNNFAVLTLTHPLKLDFHINTICIPSYGYEPYNGQRCVITGWGKDSFQGSFRHILKKIDVPFVNHKQCQTLLRKTRLGRHFRLDKSFVCAGGELNKDACYGDGGGPLVCKDEISGQYQLAGITSWGIGCGQKDVPGVYANVGLFSSWIENIVLITDKTDDGPIGYGK